MIFKLLDFWLQLLGFFTALRLLTSSLGLALLFRQKGGSKLRMETLK